MVKSFFSTLSGLGGPSFYGGTGFKRIALISLALNALYLLPILALGITDLGRFDSDQHFFYLEAVRKSVFEYGQLPLWDPWHMGGMPLLGNPQAPFSPLYLPVVFFGAVVGAKISLFILGFLGFIGTYLMARRLELDDAGGLIAAIVWTFSGMHAVQIEAGWFLFSHIHLMPWLFLCFIEYKDDIRIRTVVVMGLILWLTFMGGSPLPIPIVLFPLGVMALFFLVAERNVRPLLYLAASCVVFALTAAFKIIPSFIWMSSHPRELGNLQEGFSATALIAALVDHSVNLDYNTAALYGQSLKPGTMLYVAPEFGIYIGPIVLTLVVVGLFEKFPYKAAFITALAALVIVTMGHYAPVPLWSLVKKLPVYDSMRVVTRFRWPLLLILSLLAAFGFRKVLKFTNREFFKMAVPAAILLNLFMVGWPVLYYSFRVPQKAVHVDRTEKAAFYQVWETGWYTKNGWIQKYKYGMNALYPFIIENIGVTKGYEPFDMDIYARGKGAPDYKGEAFIHSPSGFRNATITEWSPNRVEIRWEKGQKGDLYLNQNNNPGWKVCEGSGSIVAESGLLRVPVTGDDSRAVFCYAPRHAYIGIGVSALSLIACAFFLFYRNGRAAASPVTGQGLSP